MRSAPKIMVTGANGQVGKELRVWAAEHTGFDFHFLSREDMPIHHFELVRHFFDTIRPDYCINCAAYTAVDRAEKEEELAMLINGEAVGVLAAVCQAHHTRFLHLSTDYVFNGQSSVPYRESDPTQPVNLYGASKLKGELLCQEYDPEAIIIRTAWVYSEFGNNFVKTMLRLMKEKTEISVVNDQIGAPTYAADLARVIMTIVQSGNWIPGTYHFCNSGRISWYDFANAIKEFTGSACKVNPIPGSAYPTVARRPSWSLLDTSRIRQNYGVVPPDWRESLQRCLRRIAESS